MRLIRAELHKLVQNRFVLLGMGLILAVNFFLLWSVNVQGGISAKSYHNAGKLLAELSDEDQIAYLEEHVETLKTMYRVDELYRALAQGSQLCDFTTETQQFYEQHQEEYLSGEYLDYSTNIAEELRLSSLLLPEAQEVQKYPQILQQIQADANQISSISIFQKDTYRTAETKAAADAFSGMEAVTTRYYPATGMMRAINQNATDYLLLACMLVFSLGLIRTDMDSGMLLFIQTHRKGKAATAAAKIQAFCLALLAAVMLLYGENLLYCQAMYGLGPLSRSIQSLPAFSRCTLRITAGEYLILFLLIKWMAACIMGLFAMVISLLAKQAYTGYLATILFWASCMLSRTAVSATGYANFFKYANPISFLQTNELLGTWKIVYWFGMPLPRHFVEAVTAAFLFVLCCAVFLLIFYRKHFVRGGSRAGSAKRHRRPVKVHSIWWQECYKALILQGAALVLAVFLAVQINSAVQKEAYFTPEDLSYQKCMLQLSGPWDRDAYETWQELKARAWPEQGEEGNLLLQKTLENDVYPMIQSVANSQTEGKPRQIVYESGYVQLFCLDDEEMLRLYLDFPKADQTRMKWVVCCAAIVSTCCVGIFAVERSTKLEQLLSTTRFGRKTLVKGKLLIAAGIAGIVGMSVYLPHLIRILHWYGLPALGASAESIAPYRDTIAARWPLWFVLLLDFGGVLLACVIIAYVVCWLAHRCNHMIPAVVGASLLFALPPILGLIGIRQLCPVSIFPLFTVGIQLQQSSTTIVLLAVTFIWMVVAWLCLMNLMDNFGTRE